MTKRAFAISVAVYRLLLIYAEADRREQIMKHQQGDAKR